MAQLSPRMQELLQPHLTGIEPYDPNFTPTPINLSANENTYPLPGAARDAISAALTVVPFNRYPDPMSNSLRDELARGGARVTPWPRPLAELPAVRRLVVSHALCHLGTVPN